MSSSEDSETAEWEREQMLRGTQSRTRPQTQNVSSAKSTVTHSSDNKKQDVISASLAKSYVQVDIEQVEREIEDIKRNIGTTTLDIVRSKKRIEAMLKQIEKLETSNPVFKELQRLTEPSEVLDLFDKQRNLIAKLPTDQKELIDLLESKMRNADTPMVVDVNDQ